MLDRVQELVGNSGVVDIVGSRSWFGFLDGEFCERAIVIKNRCRSYNSRRLLRNCCDAMGGTEAFPELGQHCNEETCRQLDFLPFKCDGCKKV